MRRISYLGIGTGIFLGSLGFLGNGNTEVYETRGRIQIESPTSYSDGLKLMPKKTVEGNKISSYRFDKLKRPIGAYEPMGKGERGLKDIQRTLPYVDRYSPKKKIENNHDGRILGGPIQPLTPVERYPKTEMVDPFEVKPTPYENLTLEERKALNEFKSRRGPMNAPGVRQFAPYMGNGSRKKGVRYPSKSQIIFDDCFCDPIKDTVQGIGSCLENACEGFGDFIFEDVPCGIEKGIFGIGNGIGEVLRFGVGEVESRLQCEPCPNQSYRTLEIYPSTNPSFVDDSNFK